MAVDTRNKRASAIGFALASLVVLPAPDGVIDAGDRQQTAFSYRLASAAPVIGPVDVVNVEFTVRRQVDVTLDIRRQVDVQFER